MARKVAKSWAEFRVHTHLEEKAVDVLQEVLERQTLHASPASTIVSEILNLNPSTVSHDRLTHNHTLK